MRRLFSLTLLAYPREFRDEYRASMSDHFASEAQEFGPRSIAESLLTGISMRVENVWRDVVYAVRMNVKAPLYTVVIVAAIALAIATNTVVFALLDAVLLKPLPYANPQQLGLVYQNLQHGKSQAVQMITSAQANAILRASRSFADVTTAGGQGTETSDGAPLKTNPVQNNYFSVLGVRPVVGTLFTKQSSPRDVVISYDLWSKRYDKDPRVVGKRLRLGDAEYSIVGVAPPGMLDPMYGNLVQSDAWTILPHPKGGNVFGVFATGRLKDGVTWQAAQADIARIQRNLKGPAAPFPMSDYATAPLSQTILGNASAFLWMVFAAVTGVLLIACANVANLLLVRASVREGEFAVRSAIGASSRRIASQVLTEALVLAAAGAAIGLGGAWAALPWAKTIVPGNVPRLQEAHVDLSVVLYVCGLLVLVTLVTGMLPAYRPKQKRVRDSAARLRAVLVVVEVAIAFAMSTGFGLMLQSFVSLTSQALGFSPHGVYAATIVYERSMVFSPQLTAVHPETVRSMLQKIRAIPGVQDAAVSTSIPFQNSFNFLFLLPKGWNGDQATAQTPMSAVDVGETFFHLMRIPVLAGHAFVPADYSNANTTSAIVNKAFAQAYYPNRSPIGKLIPLPSGNKGRGWRIVGVVGNTRTLLKIAPQPLIYLPYNGGMGPFYGFAIRTAKPVPNLTSQVQAIVKRAQTAPATVKVDALDDLIAKDASSTRTTLNLLGALAAVALLLGLCGVYSVVAYGTERRFHEIGIRMAVGARARNIVSLILGSALLQAVAGIAAGVVLCAFTTRLLQEQLYQTSPLDAGTLIAAAGVLVACTALAALLPACRAAFSRPVSTLRYE
jgi:putative ABC transport system permease protein